MDKSLPLNQDDPTSYHLYYGDKSGSPGTILTFFHWPNLPKGERGTSEVSSISFLIPRTSIDYWVDRFTNQGMNFDGPNSRFDDSEQVLTFHDPDGLELELVAHESANAKVDNVWKSGPVPTEHTIRAFNSVTLSEEGYERTSSVLTGELGFVLTRESGGRIRFEIPDNPQSSSGAQSSDAKANAIASGAKIVDLLCRPYTHEAVIGTGSVHHVAWRTPNDEQQLVLRRSIVAAGLNATPVIDRFYFHSVYFREPGGVLFEIATNNPGFTVDESLEDLGTSLVLPPWLESVRGELLKILPPVRLPNKVRSQGNG